MNSFPCRKELATDHATMPFVLSILNTLPKVVPQTEYSGELTMPLGGSITMLDVHTQLNIRYRLKLATCLPATDPTSGVRFTICCRSQSSCYYTHRVGYRMGNESKAEAKAAIWDGQSEKGETVAGGTYFYQL